jgi:hypothetical protein
LRAGGEFGHRHAAQRARPEVLEPGPDLFALDVGISVGLAIAVPVARAWAGARLGEDAARRRRATFLAAIGATAWLALTGAIAASGALERWERMPPPMLVVMIVSVALVVGVACSRFGATVARGLPLAALVGYQAFRIAVEFMLHRAYEQGVIGVQMTWSGRNFDVVTGVSALAFGLWLARPGARADSSRSVIWLWNGIGSALLANIVVVAVLSMPTHFLAFDGPPNAWVATFPYVWLPTVMVMAALFGHVLVARRLLADARVANS